MKKTLLTICTILLSAVAIFASTLTINNNLLNVNAASPEIKTISEIGNPTIAGTSFYDDGTLYYTNTASTVGYALDHSNTIFDFDIVYNQLAWPSWFSLTLKASGFDRTQSPNLTQKGYSFIIFPAGEVQVWKNGVTIVSGAINPVTAGTKYNYKIGAVNVNNSVNLTLKINDVSVINFVDSSDAYVTGDWFNICSDGAVSAELTTTKPIEYPNYYSYTLSTLKSYPLIANGTYVDAETKEKGYNVKVDKYNNINYYSSAACVGFNQALQNFSLEMNFNFTSFPNFTNFLISARSSVFDRVHVAGGYSYRFNFAGTIEISKNGVALGSANMGAGFEVGKNYVIEIGAVDINSNSTNLFVKVNNLTVVSVFDNDNPIQSAGWININGDGATCKITSSNTKVNPLQTLVLEDEDYKIYRTYLQNPIAYENLNYNNFSEKSLNSILVDGVKINSFNKNYYALINNIKSNAITVSSYENVLEIKVAKNIYSSLTNDLAELNLENIIIKKYSASGGIECSSGFVFGKDYSFKL